MAILKNNFEIVFVLAQQGADMGKVEGGRGWGALHCAVFSGNVRIVKVIY